MARLTSPQVWRDYEPMLATMADLVRRGSGLQRRCLKLIDGTLIMNADLATAGDGPETSSLLVRLEWLGPWDTHGRFFVDLDGSVVPGKPTARPQGT